MRNSVCMNVSGFRTVPIVGPVINRARTASYFSDIDTVWSLMRSGEAWNDEMKSSLYQHGTIGILNMSLHLQNCFQLLQMLQVQWMVMGDKDNGYLMMMVMMPFTFLYLGWKLFAFQQLKIVELLACGYLFQLNIDEISQSSVPQPLRDERMFSITSWVAVSGWVQQ